MTEQRAVIAVATEQRPSGLQVGWFNASTGEWGALDTAERYAWAAVRLHRQLRDQTLATTAPLAVLGDLFSHADRECEFEVGELGETGPDRRSTLREPWHPDVLDPRVYAAGALGRPASDPPSLDWLRGFYGFGADRMHERSAVLDAADLAECLYRLGAVPRPDEIGGAA